jgi:outer membrane receptor protein involved in Fe transport
LGGIALEQRRYLESWLASNETTPLSIVFLNKPFFPKNNELRAAGFFQMQHPLTGWLKLDCGARYDWAENYSATFNPRIALIANINNHLTVKAIYTEAFQSPGYSYRTSNASFSGSIKPLNPEKMTTYQASVRYEFLKTSFIEVTASRNYLSNLITRIGTNQKYYANVGKYASYGFEAEGQHNTKILSTFVNYSFISPITSYLDNTFIFNNIYNYDFKHFPKHTINSGIVYHLKDKYHFSLYSQYASGFRTINNNVVNQRNILNSTITMEKLVKNFEFQLSIYNLTNKLYKLGDPSVLPMEQPGRWAMVSVIYFILNK